MLLLRRRSIVTLLSLTVVSAVIFGGSASAASPRRASARCQPGQHSVGAQICARGGPGARRIVATVRQLRRRFALHSVIFGAWRGRDEIASGALGTALPGVPATRSMYFRIGNTTESFETTLLMQLVDDGKIRLTDKVSKWYPGLPLADKINVGMLASSTSGYADYVKVESFLDAFHANVFAAWAPNELIRIGTSQPRLFPPGANWSFSDTNFVLLGQILAKVGRMPVGQQIRNRIRVPLNLRSTRMTTTAAVPSPALHGYTNERGVWEDATFWNPSWATYTGNMTSTLSDLRRWAIAVGTGSLLSKRSHARQIAPKTVGLARFTKRFFYGLGVAVANKWVLAGAPGLLGYTGIVAYFPPTKTTVVAFTTTGRRSPPGTHYAGAIFNAVGRILAPGAPPTYPAG
jgi:D-alanyl-D-alanine carboxypeptidase